MYIRSRTAWYVHPGGRWQKLGRDFEQAIQIAMELNAGRSTVGTMAYWLDEWQVELEAKVAAGQLAQRTREDYRRDSEMLKTYFGSMLPELIEPKHVATYLRIGRDSDRSVRANREKAALSSCFTWLMSNGHANVSFNPCRGIKRNKEQPRDRYVEDEEFQAVMKVALPAVKAWAELIYRTLQRPSDILRWSSKNIVAESGKRFLQFKQSKTGAWIKIVITPSIDAAIDLGRSDRKLASDLLICREDGEPYSEQGIASMFRKSAVAAGVKDFAPYDLKAKGATDMYQEGRPIEEICQLCGHDSVKTTEIYVKQHLRRPIAPNDRIVRKARSQTDS